MTWKQKDISSPWGIKDWLCWWLWRRWRGPYIPPQWVLIPRLLDYNEAFVSPCSLNEMWCGTVAGDWTPAICFICTGPVADS